MNPKNSRMRIFVIFERLQLEDLLVKTSFPNFISLHPNHRNKISFGSWISVREYISTVFFHSLIIFKPATYPFCTSKQPITSAHVSQPQLAAARAPCLTRSPKRTCRPFRTSEKRRNRWTLEIWYTWGGVNESLACKVFLRESANVVVVVVISRRGSTLARGMLRQPWRMYDSTERESAELEPLTPYS